MSGTDSILAGVRVFVVEDETLVLIDIEDCLADAGATIIGPAMNLAQAVQIAESEQEIDIALLDINVQGEQVFPAAEILRRRNVPILFASGYGKSSLTGEWSEMPVAPKPYAMSEVVATLAKLVNR